MEVSLATPLLTRDGYLNKDPLLINAMWEATLDGGRSVVRRPSMGQFVAGLPAGSVQGVVVQEPASYVVIGDKLCTFPPDGTGPFPLPNLGNGGLRVASVTNFNSGYNYTSVFKSTDQAWMWTSGGNITSITDVNYPPMTVPGIAYLDGTYYVMDTGGQIHGSNLEDPTTWNALNFLSTDRGIGKGIALHRHLSYVVAFCDKGTQFFYDAANAYPGSPLSPVPNATSSVGCAHAFSVQSLDDVTIFMSKDAKRSRGFHMIQGLSLRKISTPDIERVLERHEFDTYEVNRQVMRMGGAVKAHIGYTQLYTMFLRADGHTFYIFTMVDVGLTLCYDVTNDHWSQWSSCTDGATHQAFNAALNIHVYTTTNNTATYLVPLNGGGYVPFGTGDVIGSEQILLAIRTRPLDYGTTVRKVCSELSLLGDTVTATMNLRYSNDYGQTWSAWRGINLGIARKRLTRLGTFVSRIYEFSCYTSARVRLEALVLPDRNLPAQSQPSGE
jgi:hypothetical protein